MQKTLPTVRGSPPMKQASRAAALVASAAIGATLALGAFVATEDPSDSSAAATNTIVQGTARLP